VIKPVISFREKDSKEIKNLLKHLPSMKGAYVSIGFHSDAGSYESGIDVVEVALFNEYGTSTTPARSFIRSTLDENEEKINNWRVEALQNIMSKGWGADQALSMIGTRVQILIQNKIKSNPPPPLAESTVAQKLRDGVPAVTLINTGLMLRSVTFKVFAK
jgi:hypothetical protein